MYVVPSVVHESVDAHRIRNSAVPVSEVFRVLRIILEVIDHDALKALHLISVANQNGRAGSGCKSEDELDAEWVIVQGKADKSNENYVSIISNNKAGLYLTESDGKIVLAQNANGKLTEQQTFKTLKGLNGEGVTFESIVTPGQYITCGEDGSLTLTDGSDRDACSFVIETK